MATGLGIYELALSIVSDTIDDDPSRLSANRPDTDVVAVYRHLSPHDMTDPNYFEGSDNQLN